MPKISAVQIGSLIVASLFVSLIFAEVFLRVFALYQAPPNPLEPNRPDLYQADEKVGYRLWPSTNTFNRYPVNNPETLPLNSNSDGFRGRREFDEPDSRLRILVVGDSFVFGSGVREEERLTEVLEAMEPSWRVDNLGMGGWGIDLMIRGLEHVGLKARPDIVVLAVYTDDFRRVLPDYAGIGFPIPKYVLEDGELTSVPYPSATGWRRLRIVQFLYHFYWKNISDRNRYDLNKALLDRFVRIAEQHNSKPVVIFLPGRGDTAEDQARRGFLGDWARGQQVPYKDLTRPIHDAGIEKVYLSGNWHWNAQGHRIAAETLRELLHNEVIAGASTSTGTQ